MGPWYSRGVVRCYLISRKRLAALISIPVSGRIITVHYRDRRLPQNHSTSIRDNGRLNGGDPTPKELQRPKRREEGGMGWTRESFQRGIIKAALPSDLESLLGPWLLLRGVQAGERVRYSLSPLRSVRYPSATLSRRSPPFPPNQPTNQPPTRPPASSSYHRSFSASPPQTTPLLTLLIPRFPRKHTHTEARRST
ncbi:hypothetical protein PUN28_003841 [Cardiocondyla obscurior]|uniref:Uncharacterized protein n=1 Tax=Cardiocondyla obscurior TaxID=286306 RepID=A0AAW2GKI6_9HYME